MEKNKKEYPTHHDFHDLMVFAVSLYAESVLKQYETQFGLTDEQALDKEYPTHHDLMLDVTLLYVDGVLQQYGLTDEQALDIVANVTKISKKLLIELKQRWDEDKSKQMSGATDEILGALGHQSKR